MGVFCYIPAINQYNLVPFIQTRDTEISLQGEKSINQSICKTSHFQFLTLK